ncbi:MAG: hypothetical protein ACQEP8_04040 [Chlamydiota bacterium]
MKKSFFSSFIVAVAMLTSQVFGEASQPERWALVVKPVSDVIAGPPPSGEKRGERYQNLPFSWSFCPEYNNARLHQVVFNNLVKIVDERADEAKIELPALQVKSDKNKPATPLRGWILKSSILEVTALQAKNLAAKKLPHPFSSKACRKEVTLKFPHKVLKHKKVYSAGTRFVLHDQNDISYTVYILDPHKMRYDLIRIPKTKCLLNDCANRQQKINRCLKLLKLWSNLDQGFVSYVLGGASWAETYHSERVGSYFLKDRQGKNLKFKGKNRYAYERFEHRGTVNSGYDCASLIYCAAQAVGIPYYAKNTTTIANQLQPLKANDHLEAGDLILVPGHVMIVSEVGSSLKIIQAKGYAAAIKGGKGRVCEAEACQLFKGVVTAKDLERQHFKGQALVLLDEKGHPNSPIRNWSIYKLSSCWQ